MLRVRPVVSTSDLAGGAVFLRALGLTAAQDPAPDDAYAVFDAGSGRLALRSCPAGSPGDGITTLAFEVGDVREFARRTSEAGTPVDLSEERHGLVARITSPDGTSLRAGAGPRGTGAPASPVAVVALWHTPDVASAVRVLKDMGARPRNSAGTRHDFTTKNGGLVAVHHAERAGTEPAFEYDGDVRDLAADLTSAGFEPVVSGESDEPSLRVRAPWGAELRISERQQDLQSWS
ncbi:VOC family protein [Arthrobacter sp. MDT2-2]